MKKYRTLIRVDAIVCDRATDRWLLHAVIPGWDPYVIVLIPIDSLPKDVVSALPRKYFHANTNLYATRSNELDMTDWELE